MRRRARPHHRLATRLRGFALAGVVLAAVSCTDEDPSRRPSTTSSPPSATASATASGAQEAPASLDEITHRVQDLMDSKIEEGAMAGAIVLVRSGGEERVVAGGMSRLQPATAMTRNDTFPVASVTKSMVATAVLRLVQQGRMSLADSVEDWVPGLVVDGEGITVENLLSHQSGLNEERHPPRHYDTVEDFIRQTAELPRLFQPGEKSYYSNVNYFLLGLIVEKVTGKPLSDVLETQVFTPARMTSTRLDSPPSHADVADVRGYEDGKDVTGVLGDYYAAGAVISTARDLSRFFGALLAGELLPPEVVNDMLTMRGGLMNRGSDYGLGIGRDELDCGPVIGHIGGLPGFTIWAETLEAADRFSVVMVNDSDPDGTRSLPLLEAALCD